MNKYSDFEMRGYSKKYLAPIVTPKPKSFYQQDFEGLISPISSTTPLYDSSRISSFTKLANERMKNFSDDFLSPLKNAKHKGQNLVSHKSQDFLALLKSIDSITSIKDTGYSKTLIEGEIVALGLDQGMNHVFKIHCKDKRTPLKVNIRRKYGKVRSFISKNVERPNIERCEFVNNLDCFEFAENSIKFLYDFVFLTIEAVTDTEFSLGITFGKLKNVYIPTELPKIKHNAIEEYEEIKKNEDLRIKLKNKVERLLKERKKQVLKLAGSKNFVKINKNLAQSSSEKQLVIWEAKKEKVKQKKQEIYTEKKENALKSLNKKLIQSQQEQVIREETQKRQQLTTFQESWIALSYLILSSTCFRKIIIQKRDLVFKSLQEQIAARVIQQRFKSLFYIKDRFLLHTRNNLLFFWQGTIAFHSNLTCKTIVKSIEFSAVNNQVSFSFNLFIKKIKSIQKACKFFTGRNKLRIDEITKVWNIAINKLISKLSATAASRYLRITSHLRNDVIQKFYSSKFADYMMSIKLSESKLKHRSSSLKYHRSNTSRKQTYPEFKYLPSESELRDLIEQAADAYKVI